MRLPAAAFVGLLLLLAGCAQNAKPQGRVGGQPFGWDDEAPEQSGIAASPFYVLDQSSSFLVKGASYARYVLRIDQAQEHVEVFFTSTNKLAPLAKKPNINDVKYHYEFMQLRELGQKVRVMDVSAQPAFSNGNTGHTYTLTYIYGKGANYQYLVPFEGNPDHWRLLPGYYELIVATDEQLTVGVNLKIGTPLWTTHYNPQELGSSRAEGLQTFVQVWSGSTPHPLHKEFDELSEAKAGETLNYFAFANLIHRSNVVAVGTQGTVRVQVDQKEVPHRFEASDVSAVQPQVREAYAYAVSFNEPGPAFHEIKTRLDFDENLSLNNDLAAQMLLFAVAIHPEQTLKGLPTAP
jgi:hypothetical protein